MITIEEGSSSSRVTLRDQLLDLEVGFLFRDFE